MSPRAAPMSPDERRAAIIEAVAPLVGELGRAVTTKQIAQAAGVAEGTLFRVFDDKEAILRAVVERVIDPEPILRDLDAMDTSQTLDSFLSTLVTSMQERVREIFQVAMAVRWMPEYATSRNPDLDPVQRRIVGLLHHRRDQLSVDPERAAEVLRLLIFAGTHPMINEGRSLTAPDIVAVALDGIRRRGNDTTPPAGRRPKRRTGTPTANGP